MAFSRSMTFSDLFNFMDRIELDEELEIDTKNELKPLNFDITRLKVKKVSNTDHAKKVALADEIRELWGIPIPRLMRTIKLKGYQFVWECYNECKKSNARNPAALFQWKLKQVKVPLAPQ